MKSFEEVKKHIKFLLSDLGSKNAHHTFEDVCRHFARQRIGINILPATGPVAKGGDQGRDFETFRTYLKENSTATTSYFTTNVINKTVAFGCTIQKDKLPAKIKGDIKKIVEQGTPIDGVYYFLSNDLNVSDRHKLQKWALETYKISLEIFDGEALSEQLSGKDLFWIAEELLGISSEVFPPIEDIEYEKMKVKWKEKTPQFQNWSEFGEIKAAARRTLYDDDVKHDLQFWVDKLEKYFQLDGSIVLKRKAAYEAVAVHIRGTRKLEGKEALVAAYFSLGEFNNPVEAEDALVVWSYANTSTKLKTSKFNEDDLKKWKKSIDDYAEAELKKINPVAIQAVLYELKAQLFLHDFNIDKAFYWWLKLADLIEETPLFPLEDFSKILTVTVPVIGDHPKYEELINKVDSLLANRVGGFKVADASRDRGIAFYKQGKYIKAINELHKAKIDWFADETLRGSLLSMLLIADWYLELGLIYAAKYYGLAVAYMAARSRDDLKSFLPRGLAMVARCEYGQGNWVGFLDMSELVFKTMTAFSPDLDDKTSKVTFDENVLHMANVVGISNAFSVEHGEFSLKRLKSMGMDDWFSELIPTSLKSWSEMARKDLELKLSQELMGKPFSDVGEKRVVIWKQLGITWQVEWKNNLVETSKAEQFIAVLQILLADLSVQDLYLLPVKASVRLNFLDQKKREVKQAHTNSEYIWDITLTNSAPKGIKEIQEYNMETFGIASALIFELSLLPNDRILKKIKEAMKKGVTDKTFIVSSYEVAYRDFVSKEVFEDAGKLTSFPINPVLDFSEPVNKELLWKSDLIPEYLKKDSLENIQNRYSKSLVPVKETLKELKKSAAFQAAVKKLRGEGWKDWHILMSLGSIAINYRLNSARAINPIKMERKELTDQFMKELSKPEDQASIPVPYSEFGEEAIRLHLYMTMPSTLKHLGLEIKNSTPHKEGLSKFLKDRYNYWDEDIEHENFFD